MVSHVDESDMGADGAVWMWWLESGDVFVVGLEERMVAGEGVLVLLLFLMFFRCCNRFLLFFVYYCCRCCSLCR